MFLFACYIVSFHVIDWNFSILRPLSYIYRIQIDFEFKQRIQILLDAKWVHFFLDHLYLLLLSQKSVYVTVIVKYLHTIRKCCFNPMWLKHKDYSNWIAQVEGQSSIRLAVTPLSTSDASLSKSTSSDPHLLFHHW